MTFLRKLSFDNDFIVKTKKKVIRKIKWVFLIPQIAVILLFNLLFKELGVVQYGLLSIVMYLLLSLYLKVLIPKWHRKGLFYLRKGELQGAIAAFERSFHFFNSNIWIDNYRAFILLSISGITYREMALMNIIYCYQNLGKEKEARRSQKKLFDEFPANPYGRR